MQVCILFLPTVYQAKKYGARLTENLELLLLAMDELVDKGMILETDPLAVANRVLMRGVDGDEPAADWTQFAKAAAMAKESLERAFRQ